MNATKLLIIDDEQGARFGMRDYFESHGFDVEEAASLREASAAFLRFQPDAAVLDYLLPDGNAFEFLASRKSAHHEVPIVVLTAHGSIDLAVRAIKEGAEHFLTKPVDMATLEVVLRRALEHHRHRRKAAAEDRRETQRSFDLLVGESRAIQAFSFEVDLAQRTEGPILLLGETGSGKGVLAHWLHTHGPRRDEPLVDLNCAGLAPEFLESEIFGHARGAFTGAIGEKKGLLEVAHRGTLFLDEIGDLSATVQPKLLKALEEQRFRRMGEVADRRVDVLLIAATHHDLLRDVHEGRFRRDLYFRISTFPLHLPPLRERRDDIPLLATRIAARLCRDLPHAPVELRPDALAALAAHPWPGNLRELRNVLERALLRTSGGALAREHLRFDRDPADDRTDGCTGDATLEQLELQQIVRVLGEEQGRVARAAERLGISRSALYQKIKDHGLDRRAREPRS